MPKFEDFTESAQAAAQLAGKIMERYGHSQVDTEHLLLALFEQADAIDPRILVVLDIDTAGITEGLDRTLRNLTKPIFFKPNAGKISITPRVRQVMEQANEAAIQLKDEKISGEDILLAILDEQKTPAARELERAGFTRKRFYAAMLKFRDQDND